MRKLWRCERGMALTLVLAFMVLAVPIIAASLGLASTLSIDSRVKVRLMKSQYSTIGGIQHLLYRLSFEGGYAESLPLGTPVNYPITLNDTPITVTVTKTAEPPSPQAIPPGLSNRAFLINKSVYPTAAPPDTQTTYIYTSVLGNMTDTVKNITQIRDDFPGGLTYVPGSTTGLTTSEPSLVSGDLRWNLGAAEGTLAPFTSKFLQFRMQGPLPQGMHCNDIWVSPGGDKTRSGMTAAITVGSPGTTLCPGTAIQLQKSVSPGVVATNAFTTFTYTLSFVSNGTNPVDISRITDLLPPGFSYVAGSTQGLTTANPSIVLKNNGTQQELTWNANPLGTVPPGGTVTMTFQATATPNGTYFNEVWSQVSGLNYDLYTWPTAKVMTVGVFEAEVNDNKTTIAAEIWLGSEGSFIQSWNVGVD